MLEANIHDMKSEIEDMCECSICCDKYNDKRRIPRVLPCQHTFCTNCLSKQCRRHRLKCPLCNREHYIKNGNVDTLPKDYTRNDLNGLLEKYFGHLCKECQNYYHVQYFCKTCDVQMCHFCYGRRKVDRCRTHEIEKQNIPSTSQTLLTSTVDTCIYDNICYLTDHEMNELKYFCCEQSCCIPVCANCVVDVHKGHTCKTVADEYNERKKQLLRYCRATRNKITSAINLLMTIREKYYLVTRLLEKQTLRGLLNLKDFKWEANKTAIEKYQSYLRMLEKREERVKFFIKSSTECCAISEEALSRESMIAFLSMEKTLSEQLKSFSQSDVDVPLCPMPTYLESEPQTPTLGLKETMRYLSEKTMTRNIPGSFKMSVFLVLALLVSSCVFLSQYPVPYSRVYDIDNTHLKLRKSQWFQLCISTDGRMFSNVPMENMRQTCGSTQTPFIFRGAFTNTFFENRSGEGIYFDVSVSGIQNHSSGLILFEFGVSKGSTENQNTPSIPAHDSLGWMLTVMNLTKVALKSTEGRTVNYNISVFDKTSFYYAVEIELNGTIALKTKDKDEMSYTILDETEYIKSKHQIGYAKVCHSSTANVKIKLTKNNVSFNRSTLYPNVYIADNNRTISNYPQPYFKKQILTRKHAIQDIMLLHCNLECVYVLKFRVDAPTAQNVFSLVLTNSKNLNAIDYFRDTLLTYSQCSNFRTYKSFCFMVYRNNQKTSSIQIPPDEWHSIIIMLNRKQKSALFMIGNHEIEVKNDHIIEKGTPVLRFVSLSTEDSVRVNLGDRDDFHIHTWIICRALTFLRTTFTSIYKLIYIPIVFICTFIFYLVFICIAFIIGHHR